jgi:acyl-coenzyme A thioesterase PaaI-like protein
MKTFEDLLARMHENIEDDLENYLIPPPAFIFMDGEFLYFNPENSILRTRFPVRHDFLNPYGFMQGGFTAAAIDNTIGPLSMLVAPPNVTRRLEITYSEPIKPEIETITITARLIDLEHPRISFKAEVRSPDGKRLARARAEHWILSENQIN